nr:MmcQ/YjbR family DNA-binding protein [Motilibacter peucedani]
MALSLPQAYEALVRDRVKFRVGRIVFATLSRDETVLGFGFPEPERESMVATRPEVFLLPPASDMRYSWLCARMAALEPEETAELLVGAWELCVPKTVAAEFSSGRGAAGPRPGSGRIGP